MHAQNGPSTDCIGLIALTKLKALTHIHAHTQTADAVKVAHVDLIDVLCFCAAQCAL